MQVQHQANWNEFSFTQPEAVMKAAVAAAGVQLWLRKRLVPWEHPSPRHPPSPHISQIEGAPGPITDLSKARQDVWKQNWMQILQFLIQYWTYVSISSDSPLFSHCAHLAHLEHVVLPWSEWDSAFSWKRKISRDSFSKNHIVIVLDKSVAQLPGRLNKDNFQYWGDKHAKLQVSTTFCKGARRIKNIFKPLS